MALEAIGPIEDITKNSTSRKNRENRENNFFINKKIE